MDLKKVITAECLCDCENTLIWPIILMRLKPMKHPKFTIIKMTNLIGLHPNEQVNDHRELSHGSGR